MAKKKKNNASMYGCISSIILAFLTIINLILILKMSVLPFKYLVIILAVFSIAGIIIILNFKSNKKIKKLLHVFTTIFIIVFFLIFIYLNKTTNFLNNIISKNYKTQNYIVVVNKNDNYEKIEDLKNKKISYVETDIYDIKNAINTLNNKIEFKKTKEESHENMLKSLYDKKVNAIIIEESYKDLLVNETLNEESNSLYKNFDEKTKIIYSFELKLENKNETENVKVSKEPFNVYISGIDTYGKISSVSRSDVNIVATINPKTKQILLTTIPRDYYVKLNGKNGYKDKLTHAGIYGIETSEKTIEDLLEIDINYNIKVNFTSLIKMVDAVGGVDVYSEYEFSGEKYSFKKGYNKMNGAQALEFSRTRKTLVGGDRSRGKNQEAVIAALINKMSSKAIIMNYVNILDALEDTFVTNMSQKEITELIKMQLNDMATWNITSISLDGTNGFEYTYSYKNQKLYVMIPTPSTITSAQEKIKLVIEGEKLNSTYMESNNKTNIVTEKKPIINDKTNNQQIIIEKVENNKVIEPNNGTTSNIENNIQNETISNEEVISNTKTCTMIDGMCLVEYEEITS